jgi:predicted nucleotidyltransferase
MFEELLARLALALNDRGIPYMIIGGQAVLLYGEPRLTRDIDITLGVDTDRLEDVLEMARDISLRPLPDDVYPFVKDTMVLPTMDDTTGIRVDFIFSWTPYERQAIERTRPVRIKDTDVFFASVEDVIIHKIFAGRPRDLEDVKSILLRTHDIDIEYIQRRLKEFDVTVEEGKFSQTFTKIYRELKETSDAETP